MSQSGSVVEALVQQRGSQLVGDHALSATTLLVQDPTPFDGDGGQVWVDGTSYTYTDLVEVADATDPSDVNGQLTLSSGLVQAETDLTPVQVWNGAQVLDDLVLLVATGEEGDPPAPVTLRAEQRAFWETYLGPVEPPVAVILSDDLTLLEDAPGWTPSINGAQLVDIPDPAEVAVDPPDEVIIVEAAGDALGITAFTKTPIHPSTLLDWFLDGVLIEEGTRATVIRIDAVEHALVVGTDYSVTAQPRNVVDSGALSNAVIVQLNPDVDSTTVLAWVAAGYILAGIIQIGAAMTLDETGLTITHPDGRQTTMRADGSGNQFVGQGTFDAATFLGNVLMLGQTNSLNGLLTLGSGVGDPLNKPGVVAAGWDFLPPASGNYGLAPRGLFDNGAAWYYADTYLTGNVNNINKTTGARTLVAAMPNGFNARGGVVKISTNWYVLGQDGNRSNQWWVYIFNSSWTKTGEWRVTDAGTDHSCAIGIDGAGGLLIARRSTTSNFTINVWSVAGVESAAAGTYPTWTGAEITGVWKAAVDTATVRYVVASKDDGIRVFNTSTAGRVNSEEWTPAAGVLGLGNDGTNWFSLDVGKVWKYTNLIGSWDFAFTWVDNDAGGSGVAETKRSAIRTTTSTTLTKRAKWTVSLPSAPPDDGTTDGANTASLYAAPTTTTLVRQTALPEGSLSATYSTLATSGTAPPSTSGFATRPGAIGRIISTALDSNGDPQVEIRGDGYTSFARTLNRPIVLRDFDQLDFTGATDSATELQAIITAAGAGAQIEWGRPGILRCDTGLTMLLFQSLKGTGKYMGAGGSPLTVLDFPAISSSGAGITGGGGNEIEDLIIRGPMTGAGSTIGFNSPSGSPLFRGVSFYGWNIGSQLTAAYYSRFDDCEWMYNKNAMVHAGCYNLEIIDPKIYCKYGASLASFGAGIVGGARGLTIDSGAIEGYGASGAIGLNSGETLEMAGTYFESSDTGSNAFGIIAAATSQVVINLRGLVAYLNEHNRFVDLGGATNAVIHSEGNKFVCPTTSGTAPIGYNFASSDIGNIKGHIGRDEWSEVLKSGSQYVPTGVFNLGQLLDLDIRHPSRQYLGGDIAGTGSPEGVVPGRVGAIYRRLDGGATTSLYVKTSGTGTTGWTAK